MFSLLNIANNWLRRKGMNKKILKGLTLTLCSLFISCEQTSDELSDNISLVLLCQKLVQV